MQSRFMSVIETVTSTAIGFAVAYLANITVLPAFGFAINHGQAFWITVIFTVISVARGYFVRRIFNAIHKR